MAKYFEEVLGDLAGGLTAVFAGAQVRPMTVQLIWSLLLDLPLTPATCNDFGVESAEHYRALRAVLETEAEVGLRQLGEELDRALGNGPALTALVQKYAPAYQGVRFVTSWDALRL